jgi:hypothetical protein
VDKVVDKPLLTSRNASIDAGFNNLLISQAIFTPMKSMTCNHEFALEQSCATAMKIYFAAPAAAGASRVL